MAVRRNTQEKLQVPGLVEGFLPKVDFDLPDVRAL
jgi:hypothetical protein